MSTSASVGRLAMLIVLAVMVIGSTSQATEVRVDGLRTALIDACESCGGDVECAGFTAQDYMVNVIDNIGMHTEALVEMVLDASLSSCVRVLGAELLAPAPSMEADSAFVALLEDDSAPTVLRRRAAVALGRRQPAGALDAILAAAAESDALMRKTAMLSLGFFCGSSEAQLVLVSGLEDEDWLVRINAARSLGLIEVTEASPFVLRELGAMLDEKELVDSMGKERVYGNAYLSLLSKSAVALAPDESIVLLGRLLDSEAVDATVKLNAIRALEGHVTLAAGLLSRTIVDEHQEEVVRASACRVLAAGDPESARVLGTTLLPNLHDEYSTSMVRDAITQN